MKVLKVVAIAVVGLMMSVQSGSAREFADIYTECGLGAMIAPRNAAVAAVTNVTWDLGTTAISSNISCPDSCQGGQEKVASFIYDSYENLEKDLASGHGKYLDSLMDLLKLDNEKDMVVDNLRSDFSQVVSDPAYTEKSRFEKAKTLYNLVFDNLG